MLWVLVGFVALLGLVLGVGFNLERFVNRVRPVALPDVSERAERLHRSSFVADLHADSLLFERDLLVRSNVGHVDLPRLQLGGVGLQVFTAVTRVPGVNINRNDGNALDLVSLGAWLRLSPMARRGPFDRALSQAQRMAGFIARSGGQLVPVRERADLEGLLKARAEDSRITGALLGIEGAHALDRGPEQIEPLFDAGFRLIGLAHFFDNEYVGSAHGLLKGGLTERGRELVGSMERRGMLVDLAHVSAAGIRDVLEIATRPVVVSHTGVRGTCDNNRNLSDEQLRAIAAGGGVVAIGYWPQAVGGIEVARIIAAIQHVIHVVGDEHVGLGSDFDGATQPGFDTSRLPALTQALLDAGLGESSVQRVLGGNTLRVLRQTLPGT